MAVGQLIERENVNANVASGTRPEQGNFGFTLAAGYAEIKEMVDEDVDFRGLPLMNFNYYLMDNIEIVLGTSIYSLTETFEGSLTETTATGIENNNTKTSFMRFMPGVNYHFAQNNILDTYIGLGGIIGTEKDLVQTSEKITSTGDFASSSYTKSTFVSGFNFNFGVRSFVADLPFAIGLEFGINGVNHSNLQYEVEDQGSVGGVVTKQSYFTEEVDSELQYESLEYKKFEVGANARFVLTYYFRN